eukprot:6116951-Pyramimonas_sp.AAC.1
MAGYPPPRTVLSHTDAMQWAAHGLERVQAIGLETSQTLRDKLCDLSITTSSAFSGVGAPEIAD